MNNLKSPALQASPTSCSIIESEYEVSQKLYKIINNVPSIDRIHILAYVICENYIKKKAWDLWKNSNRNSLLFDFHSNINNS